MKYNPDIHHRSYSRTMTSTDVLGGTKVLGYKIKNCMDWHALILKGMPAGVISHLNKKWGLTDKFMARMVGLSASTVSRKRKRANRSAGERLSLVQGDRLYRVARIIALAVDVFEDKASAIEWLNNKQTDLDDRVPRDMLQTFPETADVEKLLSHIKKAGPEARRN